MFAFTTRASRSFAEVDYQPGDVLLFGPESRGLPPPLLSSATPVRIPMRASARSLNLAVAVAVALFEAWRQLDFAGSRM